MVPAHTGAIPKIHRCDTRIGPGASTSADNTPKLSRQNIRGTVSAENTPRPATRAQHKRMGTVVADPTYLPTTVEHMARKQIAQAEAEKTAAAAAAAADPFQPAPSGSGRLHSTQKYAKFATHTEEWEARNKTRKELLYEALERHDKRRKKNTQLN